MRIWAVCEIQRVARGALARRLARARLRHFVDRGMRKVLTVGIVIITSSTATAAATAAACATTTQLY
jgi:hypothetical protein